MEETKVLNQTIYNFSKKVEIVQTVIIGLIAFLVPTFLAQLIRSYIWCTKCYCNTFTNNCRLYCKYSTYYFSY